MLQAVDTLISALKPLKTDVAPLHYHAGVLWCVACVSCRAAQRLPFRFLVYALHQINPPSSQLF